MTDNPIDSTPGNILVVDDTPANLALLVGMLKSKGYIVRPAPNGRLALQAAEIQPPDLIMLDINMPEMNGFEVCSKLKQNEKLREIPVIFISALSETLDKVKAFGVGGVDYVSKPFHFEEVEARIETHLKLYRYKTLIEKWNFQLAGKVREQTFDIRKKNEELSTLVDRVQKNYSDIITAFSSLVELRNPTLFGHSNNVALISERVAIAMGLPDSASIRVAGLLHDIGKIGMSDILLLKNPEYLAPLEFEEYILHSIRGQAAVECIDDLHEVGLIIRHHHEYFNGDGFPDGLKRDEIPVGSRIIGIADFLDRLIQINFLKEDLIHLALERMLLGLGEKFDPGLFKWFEQPIREHYSAIIPNTKIIELEVSPKELVPGMILAKSLSSGTGILLLTKNSQLTERNILYINRMYANDPPKNGIFVTQ